MDLNSRDITTPYRSFMALIFDYDGKVHVVGGTWSVSVICSEEAITRVFS